jgi:hypothetical protein
LLIESSDGGYAGQRLREPLQKVIRDRKKLLKENRGLLTAKIGDLEIASNRFNSLLVRK